MKKKSDNGELSFWEIDGISTDVRLFALSIFVCIILTILDKFGIV